MNYKIIPLMMTLLFSSSFAFAQGGEGSGVHGGGQVTRKNGKLVLLDLSSPDVRCDTQTGKKVYADHPQIAAVLEKLAKIDWHFSRAFEKEFSNLSFCFTGRLYRISPNDPYSPVVVVDDEELGQAGARLNDSVYIDRNLFKQMDERQQTFLLIHEVMHSYLPMRLFERNRKLRTLVNALADVFDGAIHTRDDLYAIFERNELNFPSVDGLDRYRSTAEFMISSFDRQRKLLLQATSLDSLVQYFQESLPFLSESEQVILKYTDPNQVVYSVMTDLMVSSSVAGFKALLKKTGTADLSPAIIALSIANQLSAEKKLALFSSASLNQPVHSIFEKLMKLDVTRGEYRILASPELSTLLGGEAQETPLTSLPLKVKSIETQALVQIMVNLVQSQRWNDVSTLVTSNDEFYAAYSLKALKAKLAQMNPAIAREKDMASEFLVEAQNGLRDAFIRELSLRLMPKEFDQLKAMIKPEFFKSHP